MLNPRISKVFLLAGLALIASACVMFVGELAGVIQLPEQILRGETTIHSVVRVAVLGCVLAAIGCGNE
jgi:hypothetical protein